SVTADRSADYTDSRRFFLDNDRRNQQLQGTAVSDCPYKSTIGDRRYSISLPLSGSSQFALSGRRRACRRLIQQLPERVRLPIFPAAFVVNGTGEPAHPRRRLPSNH